MKLYQNKKWLYRKYIIEKQAALKTAQEAKCSVRTIYNYLKKFKIPIRDKSKLYKGKNNPLWGKHHSEKAKRKISESRLGHKHPNWKGGRINDGRGYILIFKPSHPFAKNGRYVYEHRLVMEKHLGRYLKPGEIVHHKNEVRDDNRPDNFRLFSSDYKHLSFHKKGA